MKYQSVIAGFGGQGVVFLVKVLAICAGNRNIPFLGTENHGMSQRGGAVSCHIKIGDFTNPVIDKNQADLLIGLEYRETIRNLDFLKKEGTVVTNDDPKLTELPFDTYKADAFTKAKNGEFLSMEDMRMRAKATKTVIEAMKEHGCLGDMPETNQLSLF